MLNRMAIGACASAMRVFLASAMGVCICMGLRALLHLGGVHLCHLLLALLHLLLHLRLLCLALLLLSHLLLALLLCCVSLSLLLTLLHLYLLGIVLLLGQLLLALLLCQLCLLPLLLPLGVSLMLRQHGAHIGRCGCGRRAHARIGIGAVALGRGTSVGARHGGSGNACSCNTCCHCGRWQSVMGLGAHNLRRYAASRRTCIAGAIVIDVGDPYVVCALNVLHHGA